MSSSSKTERNEKASDQVDNDLMNMDTNIDHSSSSSSSGQGDIGGAFSRDSADISESRSPVGDLLDVDVDVGVAVSFSEKGARTLEDGEAMMPEVCEVCQHMQE
jgi:hypothetical protein